MTVTIKHCLQVLAYIVACDYYNINCSCQCPTDITFKCMEMVQGMHKVHVLHEHLASSLSFFKVTVPQMNTE